MSNSNVAALYRLGDTVGSFAVQDSSGNGFNGSLVAGTAGLPAYGYAGPFLYDPSTACDLTNGGNVLNGGFNTVDLTTQPPTTNQPLGSSSSWTYETWVKWTANTNTTPGEVTTFQAQTNSGIPTLFLVSVPGLPRGGFAVGSLVAGPNIPANTYVTGFAGPDFDNDVYISQAATGNSGDVVPGFSATGGAIGSTLFSAANVTGVGTSSVDIRVGANTAASVTYYNRVTAGTYSPNTQIYTVAGVSNGAVNVQDGAWHHIAVPYSASVVSFYVDGAFAGSVGTGGSWANPNSITMGCNAGAINGWAGAMSDVALYPLALSASQILNHYQIGTWFTQQEFGASVGGTNAGRFNKLMAVEGLNSSQMLNVPYPFKTLMYSETNQVTTTSGLNYLQTMSETEPGLIFQSPSGQINAYNRQYQYLNPTSVTSQGIFGDSNAASVQFHYDGPSFALVQDDLDVWNNVQVQSGRSGSQLQQSISPSSASVYGSRTLQGLTSLQFENDSDALAVAQNYEQWYSTPVKRVTSIMVNSWGNNGNNIPQMLQRGLYDRLTVQYQGQTPGPQFSQDSLIESIAHSVNIANGPTWATTWAMSPYEILMTPFIFGASVGSASNQLGGAASVTFGTGASVWTFHTGSNHYLSGTVQINDLGPTPAILPYNATSAQISAALTAIGVPVVSVTGQFNTGNVVVSTTGTILFATFTPQAVLTL